MAKHDPWQNAFVSKPRNEWKTTEQINAEYGKAKRDGALPFWADADHPICTRT